MLAALVVITSLIPKRAQHASAPPDPEPAAVIPKQPEPALDAKKSLPPAPLPLPVASGPSRPAAPAARPESSGAPPEATPVDLRPAGGRSGGRCLPGRASGRRGGPGDRSPLGGLRRERLLRCPGRGLAEHTLRFEPLRRLSRTFHAGLSGLGRKGPPAGIVLEYGFDSRRSSMTSDPGRAPGWQGGGGPSGLSGPSGEALTRWRGSYPRSASRGTRRRMPR
jgi:hypothetical protein